MEIFKIIKISDKNWKFYNAIDGFFRITKFYAKEEFSKFLLVEVYGAKRRKYAINEIEVYDIGGTAETFSNFDDLFERLAFLKFPAFYVDGEFTFNPASYDLSEFANAETDKFIKESEVLSNDISKYANATTPLAGTELALIDDGTGFKKVAVSEFGGDELDPFLVDLTKYSWYHWKPYSTGWFGNFLPNVVGTADNISTIFTGNDLVRATRRRYKSATTTAGSSVEFYDSIRQTQIGDGFIFTLKFGNEDASTVANARFFGGLYSSLSAIGNVNPSTLQNVLGIGADSGDTHLQLIHNDATGTATKIDLGVNFPANNLAEDVYLLQILNVRNSSDVFVRVTRVNTDTVYETTLTTDLPVSTSGGYVTPHLWRNNGTTALEVKLSCIDMNLYKLL